MKSKLPQSTSRELPAAIAGLFLALLFPQAVLAAGPATAPQAAGQSPAASQAPEAPQAEQPTLGPTAAPAEVPPPPIVLAVVNGTELTFDVAYETFLASHTGHGVLVRGADAVRELAGRLVERELFLMEAETLGVPAERDVVDVIASYHDQVASDVYWTSEVQDKVVVTDADVESFYDKTDVALGLTLIVTATQAEALALRLRVEAGEDMAQLARSASIHESRNFDGALTLVRRGELFRGLEGPAFQLSEPGSLTEVVAVETGFAFARLDQRSINTDRPPREKALPQIRGILVERAQKKLAADLEARLLEGGAVEIDEAALTRENLLEGPDGKSIVARAFGESLSLDELRAGLDLEKLRAAEPAPGQSGTETGVLLAKQWVRGRGLVAAARRSGVFESPEVLRRVNSFRRDVLLKTLCDNYVWPDCEPSEAELFKYYEERASSEFTSPLEVRLAYIVVPSLEEARAVRSRLDGGEDFEKLAREVSKDAASAMHGGRIGWVKPGELLPPVEAALQGLPKGGLDGPIETAEGCFLLRVLDRKEPMRIPYERVRRAAEAALIKLRHQEAYNTWAKALRERAEVQLVEEGVKQAVAWLDQEAQRRADSAARRAKPLGEKPAGHDAAAAPAPRPAGSRPAAEGEKP
jgi:hypothetical protein